VIPLAIPNLCGNEGRYLQECVTTNYVSSVGPFVTRFEKTVAAAVGAAHAVATSAGTTGLHAALTAVGVRRDDLVILPSFTFIASANAIAHCGASPWLFDIERESWTLDARLVAAGLERDTHRHNGALIHTATGRRVAAVVPVYAMGTPADMDALVEVARTFGLPVVADGAAALGARYKGRPIGAVGADLTVLSFNGNKTVTAGGGGAVVGEDELLIRLVRHLTTTARRGPDYDHDMVGFNYRMTNIQAAVGCAQLEHLDEFVARKRCIAQEYRKALSDLPDVNFFPTPSWADSGCWLSAIVVSNGSASSVVSRLRSRGVDARAFWKPVHLQVPYRTAPVSGSLRVCEELWPQIVTLPCSSGLTPAEQARVIDAVCDVIGAGAEGVRECR
jgi:perosamine synthetase